MEQRRPWRDFLSGQLPELPRDTAQPERAGPDINIKTPTEKRELTEEGEGGAFADIFNEIRIRGGEGGIQGPRTGESDVEFKKKIKKAIRERKYKIQGEDFERVKEIKKKNLERTGSGYEPMRQNIYWNKARRSYEDAWACLRTWAKTQNTQEQKVWDENDEREFFHEIEETDPTLYKALRTQHRDALVSGILGGAAYGVKSLVMFPGKGLVEQTVKFLLHQFIEDHKTTEKMLEMIFGKHEKEKDKKGGKKDDKAGQKAKEREMTLKVKNAEIAYVESIIEEKLRASITPEAYTALTDETRKQTEKQIRDALTPEESTRYKKAWSDMRRGWIAEGMWDSDNEKKFREDVISFDPENEDQVLVYMLTSEEFNNLIKNQNQLANQEQKTDDAAFQTKKKEWEETVQKIKETKKEIEDEEDATQKETKREELEKLKRIERVKHRPILSREDLHRRIDATIEKAKKRADDNTFNSWPPFTQNAKENTEQEALIIQDQEAEET